MSSPFARTAFELRRAFDEAFARPASSAAEEGEDVLLVRVAGDPYALRARELSGLAAGRKITPVPSPRSDFLGLAGIRGVIVPVYSLVPLLGYGAPPASSRWLALAGDKDALGLALEDFGGFVRARKGDVHAAGEDAARPHVREVARIGAVAHPIVDIASVLAVVRAPPRGPASIQER
jgi:purine-binding chemotaxis protein CheW